MYCGYANGLLVYLKESPDLQKNIGVVLCMKTKKGFINQPSQAEQNFAKFDDEKDFIKKYEPKK